MTTRNVRDLTRLLQGVAEPYGAAVNIERTGGGHLRAVFSLGVQSVFILASSTPSDAYRAYRNIRADARRVLNRFPLRVAPTAREGAAVGQPLCPSSARQPDHAPVRDRPPNPIRTISQPAHTNPEV